MLGAGGGYGFPISDEMQERSDTDGKTYTVIVSPEGIKVTVKGFRKGSETPWRTLLPTGDGE